MAESDSNSASSSSEDQEQNEESGIDELEVRIRPALPYQDEPVAQVAARTGEDEIYSDDEDEDGISPATFNFTRSMHAITFTYPNHKMFTYSLVYHYISRD